MTQMNRTTKCFPTGWNTAKPCDICDSTAALLFCRTDAAFMCMACDAEVHNTCVKHARVWVCEVCKQAPATVTCKADAAALCLACDRDIHSANPLARRHERVPVVPFYDTAESVVMKSTAATILEPTSANMFPAPHGNIDPKLETCVTYHDYILDPWTFPDATVPSKFPVDNPELKSMEFLFSDPNQFLEFDSYGIPSQPYSDSIVPVQTTTKMPQPGQFPHDYSSETRFDIDFTRSSISSYTSSYTTPSLSVSSSSVDVGVVPDSCALSDISYPFGKNSILNVDLSGSQSSSQAVGMDREARVLRYKEKRKNRKFEKTVRYASRKAYAETRPRFKGRFVKRNDTESNIEIIFGGGSANYDIAEARYGIVPSFIMEDLEG